MRTKLLTYCAILEMVRRSAMERNHSRFSHIAGMKADAALRFYSRLVQAYAGGEGGVESTLTLAWTCRIVKKANASAY